MLPTKTAQELIDYSVRLHESLNHYLGMAYWTPAMGAMLLAGIHPPSNCTDIPNDGGVMLDGTKIRGTGNTPFHEARIIFEQWNDCLHDKGIQIACISPIEFIRWCIEDEVQERNARLSPFLWINAFKDMTGYPANYIPFEVALYAEKISTPLEKILDKLNEIDRRALKANRLSSIMITPVPTSDTELHFTSNPHRSYITTEELAAALNVEPETIHKGRSKNGHYCGVRPTKLPNRRLAWPLDAVTRITKENDLNKK